MSALALHFRVAEQGKVLALAGQHDEALRHYREALRLAGLQSGADVEVRQRHYAWCVLESLERSGAHEAVISFCLRVEAHYAQRPPTSELAQRDLAAHHERHGLALAKLGRLAEARTRLESAVALAGAGRLPLAERVLGWARAGLHVDSRRISLEQDRHDYWIVRPDTVRPDVAVALPPVASPLG
jgi:tetratricopeptide (TPR) repeat protein